MSNFLSNQCLSNAFLNVFMLLAPMMMWYGRSFQALTNLFICSQCITPPPPHPPPPPPNALTNLFILKICFPDFEPFLLLIQVYRDRVSNSSFLWPKSWCLLVFLLWWLRGWLDIRWCFYSSVINIIQSISS